MGKKRFVPSFCILRLRRGGIVGGGPVRVARSPRLAAEPGSSRSGQVAPRVPPNTSKSCRPWRVPLRLRLAQGFAHTGSAVT